MNNNQVNIVGYVRVSTGHQKRLGGSLQIQKTLINDTCRRKGLRLLAMFDEAATGAGQESLVGRRELQKALKLALDNNASIMVRDISRFSRNADAFDGFDRINDLRIFSIEEDRYFSWGQARSHIINAGLEADHISRATRSGMAKAKTQGVKIGSTVHLAEVRSQAVLANSIVAESFAKSLASVLMEIRSNGHSSAKTIANELNMLGHKTRLGKPWTAENVRPLLRRVK